MDYADCCIQEIKKSLGKSSNFKIVSTPEKIFRLDGDEETDVDCYIFSERDHRVPYGKAYLRQIRAGKIKPLSKPIKVINCFNFEFSTQTPDFVKQIPTGQICKTFAGLICHKKENDFIITSTEIPVTLPHAITCVEIKNFRKSNSSPTINIDIPADVKKALICAFYLAIKLTENTTEKTGVHRVFVLPIFVSEQYSDKEVVAYKVNLEPNSERLAICKDKKIIFDKKEVTVVALNSKNIDKFIDSFCKDSEKKINRNFINL